MKPFILYSKVSSVTGKALCEALGWEGGKTFSSIGDFTHLVRWGSTAFPDVDEIMRSKDRVVLNAADITKHIVNRHHMFQRVQPFLQSANRLSVHSSFLGNEVAGEYLARDKYGRWGTDIVDVSNSRIGGGRARWDGYFLVQKWLSDFEVRVHIVNGTSVSFQIKLQKDAEGNPLWERNISQDLIIRNTDNGWHLYPLSDTNARSLGINKTSIRELAKGIMQYLGLNYGCVDFMVRTPGTAFPPGPGVKFLEVNTSPGLEGSTLTAYVDALKVLVENATPEPREVEVVEQDGIAIEDFDDDDEYYDHADVEDATAGFAPVPAPPTFQVRAHPAPPAVMRHTLQAAQINWTDLVLDHARGTRGTR